jgi:hypothetical protein
MMLLKEAYMNYIEQPNEPLVVLLYTLNTGHQRAASLTRTQIFEFIEHFKENKKYVATVLDETYGFNPEHISDFKVKGIYQREIILKVHTENEKNETENLEDDIVKAYKDKSDIFKIDCKCGTSYAVEISAKTRYGKCNNCKEEVFVDRKAERVDTHKGMAWIMTNKYFIPKEFTTKISEHINK